MTCSRLVQEIVPHFFRSSCSRLISYLFMTFKGRRTFSTQLVQALFMTCLFRNYFFMTAHYLFMTCSRHVQYLFRTCSRLVQDLFITCSWLVHNFFTTNSWIIFFLTDPLLFHNLFPICSWLVHHININDLFTACSLTSSWLVYDLFTTFSHLFAKLSPSPNSS